MKAPFPRRRERDGRQISPYLRTIQDDIAVPPTLANLTYTHGQPHGDFEVMNDIVTPGYTLISASGGIINSPMSVYREKVVYESQSREWTNTLPTDKAGKFKISDNGYFGSLLDTSVPDVGLRTHCVKLADEKQLSLLAAVQARNNISKIHVQSLVSLVELPKTISLIGDSARTLTGIIRGVKTGNSQMVLNAIGGSSPKGPKQPVLQSLSNRWLQYRYGWIPVVMEVQGALKALEKNRVLPQRATARGKQESNRRQNSTGSYLTTDAGTELYTFDLHEKMTVRAYCLYQADLKYQSARDFGVTELPLAIWELVPFSFVIDWFVQIGDWIEALTPKVGIDIKAEGVTKMRLRSCTRTFTSWTSNANGLDYDMQLNTPVGAIDSIEIFEKSRVPGLDILFSFPPINVKLNVKRTLDAIALLKALGGNRSLRT